MGARILLVDDDDGTRRVVRSLLEHAGHTVLEAADGLGGLRSLWDSRPELVMLDVSMPGMSGWQTLTRIRDVSDVPVLMLTGRAGELEAVRGLKSGADDYVTKPFRRQELLARVETLLRRARPTAADVERYADDLVTVDFAQRAVTVAGRPAALTPLEFRLLAVFVRHPNHVLSREQLLDLAWADPYAVSRSQVKLYVAYLRRKLRALAADAEPIETVRGFGYRYRPAARP